MIDLFFANVAYADVDTFMKSVGGLIINPLIMLLFALATLYFIYGVFMFISNPDNEEKKTTGKTHMLWGIIGIAIMVSVWSLLTLITNTFGITGIDPKAGTVDLPAYNPDIPGLKTTP